MAPDVFAALANPVRRQLLEALRDGPRPVNDLASRFQLSRPAVSEHLQVLRNAQLVSEERRGRQRFYRLEAEPLAEVGQWLHPFEHYWRTRMRALRDVLDNDMLHNDLLDNDDPGKVEPEANPGPNPGNDEIQEET